MDSVELIKHSAQVVQQLTYIRTYIAIQIAINNNKHTATVVNMHKYIIITYIARYVFTHIHYVQRDLVPMHRGRYSQ